MSTPPIRSHQNLRMVGSRYRLLESLGSGGMGIVYRAVDRLTGKTVALKRVTAATMQPATLELRLALAREFQSLASLRHPHIIAARDYGFDQEQQPYFTMELLPQPHAIVDAEQFLSPAGKVNLLLQLLAALVYVHRQGIIHRDLKPGNVLVVGGMVKLLDFGLATMAGQETPSSGTMLYMAPELLRGQPAGIASDLYAVGVTAYELFAGWHPFAQTQSLAHAILNQAPDFTFVELSPPLTAVLQRLLAKEPQDRYPDATAVIKALCAATNRAIPEETAVTRESFLQAAPFIGRESELAQLTDAFAEAMASRGSAWLVSGESGIGKTRLLQELRTRALVNGALVLRGQASRDGGGAYHLWSDILRPLMLLAVPSDLEAAVLRPVVPDIERLLARSILDAPSLEPKAAQTRLLLTITELVRRGARHQPLLLLLDDIHWADDNSLELLPHLNRLAAELPLFIVAGYRPGERPKLQDQLTEMRHLPLSRLTPHSIATLSEAMLGVGGRRPQLVDFLQQESEGNTFFVVEVMRALAEEAGRLDQVAGMTLPLHVFAGGMQRMVQRRLGRVAATYQPLLQLAAVAGREIELGVLAHLAADIDLEEWLTACANAAILEIPDGGLRWQFSHDRLRDGLLTQLEPSQKRTQHERIGAACEQIYAADLSDHYADLAYHYGQTENIKKERRYTRLAGEQAAAQLANEEALTYLNRALDLTAKDDRVERYELLLAREKVYNVLGKRERQLQDLVALEELVGVQSKDARQPDSQQEAVGRLAELVLRQANYAEVTGDHQAAATTAQKAIDWAQTAGMVKREAKGYLQWGLSLWRQGTYEEAQLRLERALELARAAQLPQVKADTLQNLGTMFAHQGNYASANVYWQQALHLYHEMGDRRGESHILNNLGALCGFQADYVAGKAYFERALNLYHKMGDRRGESNALNNLGSIANYLGDYVDGRMYYERAFHLFRAVGDQHGEAMSLNNLGFVARCLGEYGESKACFDQSLRLRREIRDRHGQGLTHINLGALYHRPGDYAEAGSQWEQALRLFRELGDGRGESWTLNHLGLLLHHQGDDEMAQDYSQQALQISEEIGARSQQSYALTVRGHALAGLGHPAEATVAYRQVLALRRELGEHHFAMEVVAGLARVFLTQGELHQAQAQVEAVLHYLDTRTLEGTNEPFHIYLTCYRVLKATQDQRTEKILHDAYTLLQERAAKINDASQRYLFLHHVTAHHQIVAAWEEK